MANYYREEHDYKAAITTLKSAPKMTPAVLADLGYSYELNGDKEEAAKTYAKAANQRPRRSAISSAQPKPKLRVGDLEKCTSI